MMRRLAAVPFIPKTLLRLSPFVLLAFLAGCSAPETSLALPPTFEHPMAWGNVRLSGGEEPHAYGIEVELWKRDGEVYGFISEFVGPPADAPAGRLDDVMFDEKTGALSFVAKLSVGVVLSEDGTAWLPAKNEYAFTGVVDRKTMKGSLQRRTVHPDRSISTEEESLTLDRNDSAETGEKVPVYEEWLESWEAILQARGPRW